MTKSLDRKIQVRLIKRYCNGLVPDRVKVMVDVKIVCVEVLRPSQPYGVMSSTVSLPNHTFTRQA